MKRFIFITLFFLFTVNSFAQITPMPKMLPMPKMPSIQATQPNQPVEQAITVNAGKFWSMPFIINQDKTSYKLGFDVADEQDIVVFVVDAYNFKRVTEGRKFLVNYQSGKVDSGLIDITLSRGNYFLIVSNKHAILWSKKVFLTFF